MVIYWTNNFLTKKNENSFKKSTLIDEQLISFFSRH